jgi:hypothetical protein
MKEVYDEEDRRLMYYDDEDALPDHCEVKTFIKSYLRRVRKMQPVTYELQGKCSHIKIND